MQNNFEKSSVPPGHYLCPTQLSKVLSCASFEERSSHLKFGAGAGGEVASWGRHGLGQSMLRSEKEEGVKLTVLCLSKLTDRRLQGRSMQEKQRWVSDETLPLGSHRRLTQASSGEAFHSSQVTNAHSAAESPGFTVETAGNEIATHDTSENQTAFHFLCWWFFNNSFAGQRGIRVTFFC